MAQAFKGGACAILRERWRQKILFAFGWLDVWSGHDVWVQEGIYRLTLEGFGGDSVLKCGGR